MRGTVRVGGLALLLITGSVGCTGRTAVPPVTKSPVRRVAIYVANFGSDTVTPIWAGNNRPAKPIKVAGGPQQILISPDGKTAYVASSRDLPDHISPGTLTVIHTATGTADKVLTVCSRGEGDIDMIAITPDGRTIYYLCPGADSVIPVRTGTDTVGKPIGVGSFPDAIAITPDGKTAYVANGDEDTVTPINIATSKPGKPIKVGFGPAEIAVTPNGKAAYVITAANTVVPISTATEKAGNPIKVPGGFAIAITPDGRTAYVVSMPNPGSDQGVVFPIHVATNIRGKAIKVGSSPERIAITPDGKMAYVTNSGSGTVTPIRLTTGTAGKAIKVGTAPSYLAIAPDGKTVYVVDSNPYGAYGSVTPIRVATSTAGKPIKVGRFPQGIAISS